MAEEEKVEKAPVKKTAAKKTNQFQGCCLRN